MVAVNFGTGDSNFAVLPPGIGFTSTPTADQIANSTNFSIDANTGNDGLIFTFTPGDTVTLGFDIDDGAGNITSFSGITANVVRSDDESGPFTDFDTVVFEFTADIDGDGTPEPQIVIWSPNDPIVANQGYFTTDINPTTVVGVPCLTRGTLVRTEAGDMMVEEIREGDMIVTRDGSLKPVRWIGSATVSAQGHLAPIRIKAGALDNTRDLVVSPQHRMLVKDWRAEVMFGEAEVLVKAKDLVNGDTIFRDTGEPVVEYFHILFEEHEVIFAEGAATESFNPGKAALGALSEGCRDEILEIFPELENRDGIGKDARLSLKSHEARALAASTLESILH